jgi:hypothetical protein
VQRKRLWNIHTKAKTSIGCEATPATSFEAGLLVEALQQLNVMIQDTDRKISGVCKRVPEYTYLLTIPGFGPDISAKVHGAIGNPHRFENERQVSIFPLTGAERKVALSPLSPKEGRRISATGSTWQRFMLLRKISVSLPTLPTG